MEQEKKQEQLKKQEPKKVVKLCPFISGFVVEVVKDGLGNQSIGKTTNVSRCITNSCMFYNETEQYCKILKGLDDIHNSFEIDDEEQDEQGEETENE